MSPGSVTSPLLVCISILVSCGSGDGEALGARESIKLRAIIQSTGPSPVVAVEYTISCLVEDELGLPEATRLEGTLAPPHGAAAKIGMLDMYRATWAALVDLPRGSCSIQLRGRDDDGEVVCTVDVPFSVVANTVTQVIVPLECPSAGFPSTREFNVCPDLLAFRCDELDPSTERAICVVSFRDEDQTCRRSCDPQACVASPEGLTCTPGPDPGVSTTIACTEGVLDCTGDGISDSSCTISADTPGTSAEGSDSLVASFYVACVSPPSPETPAPTITCTAIITDGDIDCNETKLVTVRCPEPTQ